MGHERLGFLPKTHRWQRVLSSLDAFAEHQVDIGTISNRVLQNVRSRFETIPKDEGVCAGFTYLLAVGSVARGLPIPKKLFTAGLNPSLSWSPLELANGINSWVDKNKDSLEYAELAKRAAADSLILWFRARNTGQVGLFKSVSSNQEIWRKSGEGGGFSDLSRIYFSKFVERYISYFLEREASSRISKLSDRQRMRPELEKFLSEVSKHAFESTEITQSFAAGWFNKNSKKGFPSSRSIAGFMRYAFYKLREEMARQESKQ